MTEAEWLTSPALTLQFRFLRKIASGRKLRLFACGFPRQFWQFYRDERSSRAIEVAEDFADGKATSWELAAANAAREGIVDWDNNVPDWEGSWDIHPLAKMAALACRPKAFDAALLVPR